MKRLISAICGLFASAALLTGTPDAFGQAPVAGGAEVEITVDSFGFGGVTRPGDYAGIRVFDVANPASLREVAHYKTPSQVGEVWAAEGTAYVAAYEAGLLILGASSAR